MCLETHWGLAPEESLINSPSPDECALQLIGKKDHSHSNEINICKNVQLHKCIFRMSHSLFKLIQT